MPQIAIRLPADSEELAPFGAKAEIPILNLPLRRWQEREVARAGLSLREAESHGQLTGHKQQDAVLIFAADAVFTAETLTALVRASYRQPRGQSVQAGVAAGTPLHAFVAPQNPDASTTDLPLPIWAGRPAKINGTTLVAVCNEQAFHPARVGPLGPPPSELRIPDVRRFGGRLCHWLHVLNFNQALLETERARRGCRGRGSVLGRGVQLAPNVTLEGSILEDEVEVEASASVLQSYLGQGVRVGAHTVLERCVIGDGCHTLVDTQLRRVIAHRGSTLSNLNLHDVVLGSEIFVTTGVSFFAGFPGEEVMLDGENSGRPVLGGAVGPRSILGARALFGAGVAVPPGTVIVGRPDEAAAGVSPEKLARAHMEEGGPESL